MEPGRDIEASSEDLDVSMTQAPLVLFIPYAMALVLGTAMFAAGTFFHTWKAFLVAPALWALAAVWTKRDRNAIAVLQVKTRLLAVWVTAHPWGGWSINPPDRRTSKKVPHAL